MADMRQPGGGAPQSPPQGGAPQDAMAAQRSPFNPVDQAYMQKSGQVSQNMTIGQYFESAFGIKWEDPLTVATQKMKEKLQVSTPMGKMQAMAGGAPGGSPEAQSPPPSGNAQPQGGGMAGLMSKMGQ